MATLAGGVSGLWPLRQVLLWDARTQPLRTGLFLVGPLALRSGPLPAPLRG